MDNFDKTIELDDVDDVEILDLNEGISFEKVSPSEVNEVSLSNDNSLESVKLDITFEDASAYKVSDIPSVLGNPADEENDDKASSKEGKKAVSNSKKNNKFIYFLILVIGVLIVGFLVWKPLESKDKVSFDVIKNSNLEVIFDSSKLIPVSKDNKDGYISSSGEMVIEPQFKEAFEFYGSYAVVSPFNKNGENITYQIIDKKGDVKLETESHTIPIYLSDYDVWIVDDVLYDSNLNKILDDDVTVKDINSGYFTYVDSKKKKSGIIDFNGNKIFSWSEDSINASISQNLQDESDLYVQVSTSDSKKVFVVSLKSGKTLYKVSDTKKYYLSTGSDGMFSLINSEDTGDKTWLYFAGGKLLYENNDSDVDKVTVYDNSNNILQFDYGYNYSTKDRSQQYYYYDVKSKNLLNERPEKELSYDLKFRSVELDYGYKPFSASSKYGLMKDEKVVIPAEYSGVGFINVNLFEYMKKQGKEIVLLRKDKQVFVMDVKSKKVLMTFDAYNVTSYNNSTFLKTTTYSDDRLSAKTQVFNLLSLKNVSFDDDEVVVHSNYIVHKVDGKSVYYNTDLKEIYTSEN